MEILQGVSDPESIRFLPMVVGAVVLPPITALFTFYSFRSVFRHTRRFWSPLTALMVVSALLCAGLYAATVVVGLQGIGVEELASVPPTQSATTVYNMLMITAAGFIVIGLVNLRIGRERLEFAKEREQIRKENRFKSRILNIASHELNTPLTPIRAELEMLQSGLLGELNQEQTESLDVIARNLSRLGTLVREMLDVTRMETDRLPVAPQEIDLAPIIDDAVRTYKSTAVALDIRLERATNRSLRIHADPQRTLQILINLLDNAMKFTPRGGKVRVTGKRSGDTAQVQVKDTGVGMDPNQLTRLFQPFGRVHDSKTSARHGTGLGLFICRNLAEEMGGTLVAESEGEGHGSTFTLRLPLV